MRMRLQISRDMARPSLENYGLASLLPGLTHSSVHKQENDLRGNKGPITACEASSMIACRAAQYPSASAAYNLVKFSNSSYLGQLPTGTEALEALGQLGQEVTAD
jgi:hypothetical protein